MNLLAFIFEHPRILRINRIEQRVAFKAAVGYTKISGSSAATKSGVNLHLFLSQMAIENTVSSDFLSVTRPATNGNKNTVSSGF